MASFLVKALYPTLLGVLLLLSTSVQAQISGTVFRDFNANGTFDTAPASTTFTELGLAGVEVRVYNAAGANVTNGTVQTTGITGAYTVTPTGTGPFRVEFTIPTSLSVYNSGPSGTLATSSGSSVQFVSTGTATVNFGVNYPRDYCQANPDVVVPCFVSGNPLATGSDVAAAESIVITPYTSVSVTPAMATDLGSAAQVGSVWGSAYQRSSGKLFSAAFLKRHVGLGPLGLGGIYVTTNVSFTATAPTSASYANLATLGLNLGATALGTRTLPSSGTVSSADPNSFSLVGKAGLGGMAFSDDETKLYVIDLSGRQLVVLNVGSPAKASLTAADVQTVALPATAVCTNGTARPFGITVYQGKVYVGVVCTGEAAAGVAANLQANVYALDVATQTFSTTPVLTFPLTYPKGLVHASYPNLGSTWNPWSDSFAEFNINATNTGTGTNNLAVRAALPQPILSAISFADNGDMIVGFMDRGGHQLGYRQRSPTDTGPTATSIYSGYVGGDILRARLNGTTWTLENNGSVTSTALGTLTTAGASTSQGPGNGEFYFTEEYNNATTHQETSQGGTAVVPGTNQVVTTVMDPLTVFSGGFSWFNNTTGDDDKRYQIYVAPTGTAAPTSGKANGLGGVTPVCYPAPVQIGNRVWRDTNDNGIQDPGEPVMAGVQVILRGPNNFSATATTNANGNYYFTNAAGTNVSGFTYGLALTSGSSYTLSFPTNVSATTISTKPLSATGTNATRIDSDADAAGRIVFTLGQAGVNNLSFDVGFVSCFTAVTTASSNAVCLGQPVVLTTQVTPAGSYTYAVTGPAGTTITGGTTGTATVSNLASGVNNFTVTISSGPNCVTTNVVSITATAASLLGLTASTSAICVGQAVTLSTSLGGLVPLGSVVVNTVGALGLLTPVTSNILSPTATTTFLAQVPILGGLVSSCPITVIVNQPPALTAVSTSLCVGSPLNLTSVLAQNNILTGLTNTLLGVGTIPTNLTVGAGVNLFNVLSTNASGCTAVTPVTITGVAAPALSPLNLSVCVGTNLDLTSLSGLTGLTNVFRLGNTLGLGTLLSTPTSVSIGAGVNLFNVVSTNPFGCTAATPISVTGVPGPTVSPIALSVCVGTNLNLTSFTGLTGLTNVFRTGSALGLGTLLGTPTSVSIGAGVNLFNVVSTNPLGCTTATPISVTGVN
ncbi:SdrD B-like domain-containing protein, partial [Fibrella forsythiae]